MEREPLVTKVGYYYEKACLYLAILGMTAIAVMGLSTSFDVLKRWLTGWPFEGVMQLSECLLVMIVFLGIPYAQSHRRHIRITFLVSRMSQRMIVLTDALSCLIAAACLSLMAWQTLDEAIYSWIIREYRPGNVRLPIYWARALLPIGLFAMVGQLVIDIWKDIMRLKGQLQIELPDIRRIPKHELPENDQDLVSSLPPNI